MITTKAIDRSRTVAMGAALALLASSVSPALAASRDPDASASAAGEQTASAHKAQQICVDEELTGSRIPHRVCKTRDRWIKEDGVDPLSLQVR